jgi:predicted ATPase
VLRRVEFTNFKALEKVSIELERLTVLVGANATGKTSVLEGIHTLCELVRPHPSCSLERIFSGRRAPGLLASDARRAVSIALIGPLVVQLDINNGARRLLASRSAAGATIADFNFDDPLAWDSFVELEATSRFPRATLASFNLQNLAAPSYASETPSGMDATGSGLATIIAELLVTRAPELDAIQDEMHRIIPSVRRLRAPSTTITRQEHEILTVNGRELVNPVTRTYRGHRLEVELVGTGFIPIEALSEGTLLVLGLLTLLHTSQRPHVFLLDDIDRGLHPEAQRLVVEALRRFVDEHEDVQIVCTSHSPYALDHFKPEEVRVMKADRRGRAHCRKLTEHPDWDYWKDTMKAGEFWSSVGEAWVYEEEKDAG